MLGDVDTVMLLFADNGREAQRYRDERGRTEGCVTRDDEPNINDLPVLFADERSEIQRHQDEQKLEERRKKEAYLLVREAHYQQEQERLNRIKEAQEGEAVTKLLLQAKLAPTPQTAGNISFFVLANLVPVRFLVMTAEQDQRSPGG